MMVTSFALVRNLKSTAEVLQFTDFRLTKVGSSFDYDLKRAQHLFKKEWPLYADWIYERSYEDDEDNIPFDLEDTLLLLRLFKAGDIFFIAPCKEQPDGSLSCQLPYPAMVHSHSVDEYVMEATECSEFNSFALELTSKANWTSGWFRIARRFFLYGGGKEYNPIHSLADRIVDYMIALEAVLVPEHGDFIGRRLRERASCLLGYRGHDNDSSKRLLKEFYDVRSAIAHGTDISRFRSGILTKNVEFEVIVRKLIVEALKLLPTGDSDRLSYLKRLFEVSDRMRAEKLYNDFGLIKDGSERKACFDSISRKLA